MTVFQPARWKNVASGQAATNASQRPASAARSSRICSPATPVGSACAACSSMGRFMMAFQEQAVHAPPLEILEQHAQPPLHRRQVDVVPEAAAGAGALLARLARIDLPGMEVED